jgi:stage III sporulation protein AG
MFEKLKKIFNEKDEKKKIENLLSFLVILVITLIIINKIISVDTNLKEETSNSAELVNINDENDDVTIVSSDEDLSLEEKLKNILSKMNGVGKVEVLLTYSETSSVVPLYNESTTSSTTTDSDGVTTKSQTENKEVFTNGDDEAVLEKKTMPKLEGAIVIAEGAGDTSIKTNIISAVEAVTRAS